MQIDSRKSSDILDDLKACAPLFMAHLDVALQSGPGGAMTQIFSEMTELIIKRLNKVPDNNFLAFLDVLGVKLLPPQPAVVPVTFSLSTGAPDGVRIPAKTSVMAGDIHFETDHDIWAVVQKIVSAFIYQPSSDRIFACPGSVIVGIPIEPAKTTLTAEAAMSDKQLYVDSSVGFAKGDQIVITNDIGSEYATVEDIKDKLITLARPLNMAHSLLHEVKRVEGLNILEGEDIQEHSLYIAHSNLFNLKGGASIVLSGNGIDSLLNSSCIWEYWGVGKNGNIDWQQLESSIQSNSKALQLGSLSGEIKSVAINGITSRWIRCRITDVKSFQSKTVSISLSVVPVEKINPDMLYYNDIPIDFAKSPILPFGTRPCQGDAFYLASQQVFSKSSTTIQIEFKNFVNETAEKHPQLSWEYWNGKSWTILPVLSGLENDFNLITDFINNVRTISFKCQSDFSDTVVAGQLNKWIRIRIASGDYGNEMVYQQADSTAKPPVAEGWISKPIIVPKFSSIKFSYDLSGKGEFPEECLTLNNKTFYDLSKQVCAGNSIMPFELLSDAYNPSIYFSFNEKLTQGPISIYFSMDKDISIVEQQACPVRWYCFTSASGWRLLDTIDNTQNLTRSGTIEFLFPSDFASYILFGQDLFWIKACFEGTVPPLIPSITAIYLNTITTTQAETISNEILGSSDTSPNQKFTLTQKDIIDCQLWIDEINSISEEEKEKIIAAGIPIDLGWDNMKRQCWVQWTERSDFLDSKNSDRHYVIDHTSGEITFGNGINGMIPPPGIENIKTTYRVGGGVDGNIEPSAISTLKTSIQFVEKVTNPLAAEGGADAETIESIMQRGPYIINHRNRAVTEQDFERLAAQASSFIKRTKCYTTGTALVHIIVIPDGTDDQPMASLALKETIERYLSECCLNTVIPANIVIEDPQYIQINTTMSVIPVSMDQSVVVQKIIYDALKKFFHPITGGPDGTGWEFGRDVHVSDVYGYLGQISGIDHIRDLKMGTSLGGVSNLDIIIGENNVVCSGIHKITITMAG